MAVLQQRQAEIRARLAQQTSAHKSCSATSRAGGTRGSPIRRIAIAAWQQQRELEKLQARAEKARKYAIDMVTVAAYDFEEAEQAVFEAVAARLEADSALAPAR